MDGEAKPVSKGGFSFGLMIFGIFVIVPAIIGLGVAFDMKNTHDLRLECLKQGKTYVNDMCLQMGPQAK